jgi:hypothetical protein
MTNKEAEAGIGQRVRDTESDRVGLLVRVEYVARRNYHVGVVNFHGQEGRVWLKHMQWVDGPPPTPLSKSAPHGEVLAALARYRQDGKLDPIFVLLFGRPPTPCERSFVAGRLGGTCRTCGLDLSVSLLPNGTAAVECACPPAPEPSAGV